MLRAALLLLLVLVGACTTGCGADFWSFTSITSGPNTGSTLVLVWLSDSPVDEASNLWLTVERVEWVGATTTTALLTQPRQIDVLALQAGVRTDVGRGDVPADSPGALRITFAPEGGGRHRIRVGGQDHELAFESAARRVLELPVDATLVADGTLEVQVDLNARLSVVSSGALWLLRPSAQAFDTTRAGTFTGRTLGEDLAGITVHDAEVIRPLDRAYSRAASIVVLRGSLAPESAIARPGLRPPGQTTAQPDDLTHPAIPRVQTGGVGPDRREPAGHRGSRHAVLQDVHEGAAPRSFPVGVAPAVRAARREVEPHSHRALAHVLQREGRWSARPPAAACVPGHEDAA